MAPFPADWSPCYRVALLCVPTALPLSHRPPGVPAMGLVAMGGPGRLQGVHAGCGNLRGFYNICQDEPSAALGFTRQPMWLLPCGLQQ